MAFKTVQVFDPTTPMDLSPDFDRSRHPHLPSQPKLIDLIERGELPRFRGAETQTVVTPTEITVTIEWKSQAVAEEYAAWAQSFIDAQENAYLRSVQVVID